MLLCIVTNTCKVSFSLGEVKKPCLIGRLFAVLITTSHFFTMCHFTFVTCMEAKAQRRQFYMELSCLHRKKTHVTIFEYNLAKAARKVMTELKN